MGVPPFEFALPAILWPGPFDIVQLVLYGVIGILGAVSGWQLGRHCGRTGISHAAIFAALAVALANGLRWTSGLLFEQTMVTPSLLEVFWLTLAGSLLGALVGVALTAMRWIFKR